MEVIGNISCIFVEPSVNQHSMANVSCSIVTWAEVRAIEVEAQSSVVQTQLMNMWAQTVLMQDKLLLCKLRLLSQWRWMLVLHIVWINGYVESAVQQYDNQVSRIADMPPWWVGVALQSADLWLFPGGHQLVKAVAAIIHQLSIVLVLWPGWRSLKFAYYWIQALVA